MTTTYGVWTINREGRHIEVSKDGQLASNTSAALRKIAEEVGLEVNPDWRTSQLGSNVIKAILLDATPDEIKQQETQKSNSISSIDGRHMHPIHELYIDKSLNTKLLRPVPYLYRWWFPKKSKPMLLLDQYISEHPKDIDMQRVRAHLKERKLGKKTYYALYIGKSINGRNRFSQHIRGNVDLSTLRKTIYAVLSELKETPDEDSISKVLNECYYEWVELEHDHELLDSFELLAISLGCYPLNLDGNSSISDTWKKMIMDNRKELKNYK